MTGHPDHNLTRNYSAVDKFRRNLDPWTEQQKQGQGDQNDAQLHACAMWSLPQMIGVVFVHRHFL
ncbi:Protein of unknown function [Pyronema omphalodes CBS 100304]|uniref:Uncharacterized protein n=1 Tax=Pyronema omphalodes (strain CBS 100304) TaxID=1076935 RepID=U4LVC5_PYROM|nr:Protein of unknown function [Pyronema omphalodes CBS 100304]